MAPLTYEDDAKIHQKTDAFDWRESFYCNFFDTESRYFGTVWHGVRPNQERGESVFVLFDRGEPLIYRVDTNVQVPKDIGEERRGVSHHRFECIEPWRHWRVHFDDGEAKATIDWRQFTEICDWDDDDEGDKEFLTSAKHCEAGGRIKFEAELPTGRKISFTGYGERDRAWGIRNYGPLSFSWWQTLQFPDEVAMHVWAMVDVGGKMRLYGFLHKDGVTRPARHFSCEARYGDDDGPPEWAKFRLVDDHERELVVNEMSMMQVLAFRTEKDGAALEVGRAYPEQTKGLWFWTWQRYVRDDGVIGGGMVDLNLWRDYARTSFEAHGPYGTLYSYGLGAASGRRV